MQVGGARGGAARQGERREEKGRLGTAAGWVGGGTQGLAGWGLSVEDRVWEVGGVRACVRALRVCCVWGEREKEREREADVAGSGWLGV